MLFLKLMNFVLFCNWMVASPFQKGFPSLFSLIFCAVLDGISYFKLTARSFLGVYRN